MWKPSNSAQWDYDIQLVYYVNLWLVLCIKSLGLTVRYCKRLIIRVTLFLRDVLPGYIHEIVFSQFVIWGSIVLM